ncbi:sensor histidine kinase [Nevskia ramosa]|uniref:sensor histidine kinase n=1 Tax=Nevskia ramosa TaxID=64002 RepID=UPI0023555F6A|nr:histidine kinase [Nevskia ramosa]
MLPIAKALKPKALLLGVVAGVAVAGVALQGLSPEWRMVDPPLHSAVESLGGLSAMAMAMVLLARRRIAARSPSYLVLALGFLGMGMVEVFHAMAPPGHLFVWFRVLASLVGGLGFALVWWPDRWRLAIGEKPLLLLSAAGIVVLGIGSWILPQQVPVLVEDGAFTPLAFAFKNLACALFGLGAARLFWNYARTREPEDYLFGFLALLFAIAESVFNSSSLWDRHWWFWHFLRLMAYAGVLAHVGRSYLCMVSDLGVSLAETRVAETALRLSESQLRQSLDERERLARDLHDSIIQSIYAIGLRLSECRRLAVKDAEQAVRQLGVAINEVNSVIREVRLYISGIEVEVMDGKALEAGMAALIHTLDGGQALRFYLQMDSAAAERLTPFQATHLLFIAKESMSNSLRHSQARNGGISLKLAEGVVRMIIEDDGVGFDTNTASPDRHGLKNIRTRAERLGAGCELLSAPGTGTRITIDIPFDAAHAAA